MSTTETSQLRQTDTARPCRDLTTRREIHDLVINFYREVVFDNVLGPVFEEVAEVDWSVHIPKLIDYWCRVLLGEVGYSGALLTAHQQVHALQPLGPEHFERWLTLFVSSVNARWSGPKAELANAHAEKVIGVLRRRLDATGATGAAERLTLVEPST